MEGSLGLKYTALERSATETLEDGSATETPNGNIPEILEEGATESEEHSSQTQKNGAYNNKQHCEQNTARGSQRG